MAEKRLPPKNMKTPQKTEPACQEEMVGTGARGLGAGLASPAGSWGAKRFVREKAASCQRLETGAYRSLRLFCLPTAPTRRTQACKREVISRSPFTPRFSRGCFSATRTGGEPDALLRGDGGWHRVEDGGRQSHRRVIARPPGRVGGTGTGVLLRPGGNTVLGEKGQISD